MSFLRLAFAVFLTLLMGGCASYPPPGAKCTYPTTWTRHDRGYAIPNKNGLVKLELVIDTNGSVRSAQVVESDDPELDVWARLIAMKLVFNQPTLCDGQAYWTKLRVPLTFAKKSG